MLIITLENKRKFRNPEKAKAKEGRTKKTPVAEQSHQDPQLQAIPIIAEQGNQDTPEAEKEGLTPHNQGKEKQDSRKLGKQ